MRREDLEVYAEDAAAAMRAAFDAPGGSMRAKELRRLAALLSELTAHVLDSADEQDKLGIERARRPAPLAPELPDLPHAVLLELVPYD